MAILGALPGIEVTIESQGTALSEYNDDTEWAQWAPRDEYSVGADKWMSKYVECVSDTEFQLRFSMKPPFKMDSDKLSFDVSMDGQGIAEIGMKKGRGPEQSVVLSTSFEQVTPHELALRALRFASIQKVDDVDFPKVKTDAEVAAEMGEIRVSIYRSREEACGGGVVTPALKNAPTEIAEKALKGRALSHGICFGEETRRPSARTRVILIDGGMKPIGIVVFKYRSREALKQELIIPRSPSPDLVMGAINPRNVNPNPNPNQESREKRIARLQRELNSIKAEVKVEHESNPRDRKRSAGNDLLPTRAYKTIRKPNGALIYDLTDDD